MQVDTGDDGDDGDDGDGDNDNDNQFIDNIISKPNISTNEFLILNEFLPIVKTLIKSQRPLSFILNTDRFVFTILRCAFLKNPIITSVVFEYLSIICSVEDGYNEVINIFDHLTVVYKEPIRFQKVFSLLKTARDHEVAESILLFFNLLIEYTKDIPRKIAVG